MDLRDSSEFQSALLAGRVIEAAVHGKNVISNIIGYGINIEISATMDKTLKQPTEYFYESNQKEDEEGGIELLAALCHDLNDSRFTYYTKRRCTCTCRTKSGCDVSRKDCDNDT